MYSDQSKDMDSISLIYFMKQRVFTIIDLIVVIIIVAIIAGFVFLLLQASREVEFCATINLRSEQKSNYYRTEIFLQGNFVREDILK
jgi:peptidoglycan/LPS O-acetylase OafA/YrhL